MIYIPFDYVIYTTIIVTLIHLSSTIFIKAIEDHALNKDFDVILNNVMSLPIYSSTTLRIRI